MTTTKQRIRTRAEIVKKLHKSNDAKEFCDGFCKALEWVLNE